jgi:hypothetical protein
MRRAHEHQSAYIAIRGYRAELGFASWTNKTGSSKRGVTSAQGWRSSVRQPGRKSHKHQIRGCCSRCSCSRGSSSRKSSLCRWRDELEEKVSEVTLIQSHPECTLNGCQFTWPLSWCAGRLTSSTIREFTTNLHLCSECNDRNTDAIPDASLKGIMNCTRINCCQTSE